MNTKIKIGDMVKIIDDGETYTSYETAAKAMKLKNWISEHSRSLKNRYYNEYIVVGMFLHPRWGDDILGITNGIEDFVIGIKGVEFVRKSPPLKPKEAKTPQRFDINHLYPYTD